jgi:copper chaperone NosL
MKQLKPLSRVLIALSSLLMISAYVVPIWQILMWAPQYPEGLEMKIWINDITGDVRIISALNHYIGMKHIDVSMFPEFTYMIYIVGGLIVTGLIAAIVNRRILLILYVALVVLSGIAALVDFWLWGYNYGHNLDPTAPIVVPGMSYQPPLIGTKQLLNFTAYSGPDIGGWIFLVAGIIAVAVLVYEVLQGRRGQHSLTLFSLIIVAAMVSCKAEPEPLNYNEDACHACKMTLSDNKFGAEIVTRKGKVFKFDDLNCMLDHYHKEIGNDQDVAYVLVTDFANPGTLIDARNCFYLKSERIKTPMASNVAAFQDEPSAKKYKGQFSAILLSWGEIQTQFK